MFCASFAFEHLWLNLKLCRLAAFVPQSNLFRLRVVRQPPAPRSAAARSYFGQREWPACELAGNEHFPAFDSLTTTVTLGSSMNFRDSSAIRSFSCAGVRPAA